MKLKSVFLFLCVFSVSAMVFAQDTVPMSTSDSLPLTAKVVLIAAVVSAVIKALRELLDKFGLRLGGPLAVAMNVVAAAALYLGTVDASHLLSVGVLAGLGGVILAAAGMHDLGTFVRGLFAPKTR